MENNLRYIKDMYGNPAVFVTENGYSSDHSLNDTDRVSYHKVSFDEAH